jgi:hypothetical protein
MNPLEQAYFITGKGKILPFLLDAVSSGGGSTEVNFVAQENIAQYDVVTSKGYRADTADYQTRNIIIGFATTAVLNGFPGKAIGVGEVKNPAWTWIKGDKIFLNGLGSVSTSPPVSTYSVLLGTATASTIVDANVQPSILL